MKELERSNRVAMIAHGVINACMLFISVIGFVEHTVSAPVLVVLGIGESSDERTDGFAI